MLFLGIESSEIPEFWDIFHFWHSAYLAWDIGDFGRTSQRIFTDLISKLCYTTSVYFLDETKRALQDTSHVVFESRKFWVPGIVGYLSFVAQGYINCPNQLCLVRLHQPWPYKVFQLNILL